MKSDLNYLVHGKANRPNQSGRNQIANAEEVILLPAVQYFANRNTEGIWYGNLYIGIAVKNGVCLPIQSTKHYWLSEDIDKAKRAIRKSNIDVSITVTDIEHYQKMLNAPTKELTLMQKMKKYVEETVTISKEIKRVFALLEEGEQISVTMEVGKKGYSITFDQQILIGYSHVTDADMNILYYPTADEAINVIKPLRIFINCRFSIDFTDTAKFSPMKSR